MHLKNSLLGSLAILLSVVLAGGGLWAYKRMQIQAAMAAPPMEMPPESVTSHPVVSVTYRQSASAVGTVVAPRWVTLRNEVSGAILKISVASGAQVEQGAVMIELDKSVEQASLESAEARCRITESTFKRLKQAMRNNATTELEMEQAEAELAQAKAEQTRLQAIIEKKTMRAPFAASVGLINVHEGQFLSEGTEITTLQGIDNYIHIDFMVPQTVADQLALNQAVTIRHAGQSLNAEVQAFDSKADRATRNTMVRAKLLNPPRNMTPNDSVDVEIDFGPEQTALAIPIEAIRRAPSGAHAFVVEKGANGNLMASMRTILPGRTLGREQVILGGLMAGDQVISDGSFKLHPGSPIVLKNLTEEVSQ